MHVGIKYCGGCHPAYDRAAAVSEITAAHPEHSYSFAKPDENYDLLLVVCGCKSRCADLSYLSSHRVCLLDCAADTVKAHQILSASDGES